MEQNEQSSKEAPAIDLLLLKKEVDALQIAVHGQIGRAHV